ncbi:hypothetical protein Q8A73_005106 [Channa argus]|nr:hypothetical protein Q8A73_005106 [Channa argus]
MGHTLSYMNPFTWKDKAQREKETEREEKGGWEGSSITALVTRLKEKKGKKGEKNRQGVVAAAGGVKMGMKSADERKEIDGKKEFPQALTYFVARIVISEPILDPEFTVRVSSSDSQQHNRSTDRR